MKQIVNEALMPIINDGLLSVQRIHELIYIKEFIERVSTRKYLEERDAQQLLRKYGVLPNIITWGDYFQTEMASSLIELDDEAFSKAIATVKFDIISACEIFAGKGSNFFKWVDDTYYEIASEGKELFTEEEEEIMHLKIMKDYYCDLGIVDRFTESEMEWYREFNEALAI